MADREFSTLVARANPSVPGCPVPTITNYVRDAARQACERSLAYRYEVPLFDLLPGVHEYAYDKPTNTDVHAVFAAHMNGSPLSLLNLDEALMRYPAWADLYSGEDASEVWSETPSAGAFNNFEYNDEVFNAGSDYVLPDSIIADGGSPRAMCQVTPDKFVVLPLPDGTTYTMRMFVALKPKWDATGMNSVAFDELEDVILHRALQNLMVLPNVPWSNPDLASYHARQYLAHSTERRARANLGNVRGSMSVRMRPFA